MKLALLAVTFSLVVPPVSGQLTTAALIRDFRTATDVPAKERILYRITERGPDAGRQLLQLAETTDDATTRWLAIRGLAAMKFSGAAPFLMSSLTSPAPYVRANAARALGEIRYSAAVPTLIDLLKTEPDSGVMEQTATALRMMTAREAVPALKARMAAPSIQTRCYMLNTIGGLGSDADVPYLAKYLDQTDLGIGECTARALDELTHGAIGLPLPQGLFNPGDNITKARKWWDETGKRRYPNE